jgi:hypothetical protein
MPEILFAAESAESRSLPLTAQRLVNFFTEKQSEGAKTQVPLFAAPGMSAFANTASVVGAIAGLGPITGGSGYGSGSYANVPLIGGSGSGAIATITVAAGAVTVVTITGNGANYLVGDVLSALSSSIGGAGSGFSITVTSISGDGIAVVNFTPEGQGEYSVYSSGLTNVPLTGGSGTGATANIGMSEIASGIYGVTSVAIVNPGINYKVGDILSAAIPFAYIPFSVRVSTLTGGSIASVGDLVGGTGYDDAVATYSNVPLTGGSGSGATANFTATGGVVTTVAVSFPGINYLVGDILSASNTNLGGSGSGFSVPVAVLNTSSPVRGSWEKQDVPYVVAGNSLYQLAMASSGVYQGVPLTGGSGTGAVANITVATGVVAAVSLTANGVNYQVGDILSAPLGGGSGFLVPVATLGAGGSIATLGSITGGSNYVVGVCTCVGSGIGGTDIVGMADNGSQLCIVSGGAAAGWIFDTNPQSPTYGFQQITDPSFYPANTVTFFDGYFVFDRMGTNELFVSNLYNGTTYNGLAYASAESQPDFVIGTIQNLQLLFVICEQHLELWYDAGAIPFPFARYTGAGISYGSESPHTIIKQDGAIFFLGRDKVFYRLQSTVPVRVSTHAIEHIIAQDPDITQAYCLTFTWEGHKQVVLTLPASRRTLVYDISTGKWHERESWDQNNASLGIWRASTAVRAFNNTYLGDAINGNVNLMDWGTYTELGNTIRGLAYSIPYNKDRKRLFVSRFELDIQAGVGTPYGPGSNPQIQLGWSTDGAQTFKPLQFWRSMGRIGQYYQRLRWLRMGQGRQFVFVISCTDPVPRVIIGASADISVGM